jgi:RNA polymerase sigma-70 factor (ECF subfamily)
MDANDLDRLAKLVNDRAAGLALFARQWLNAAAAEDVVQDALIALLSERRPPEKPLAWMYRAVRNAAIDEARADARRRQREQALAQTRHEWFEAGPDALLDAKMAQQALERLTPDFREIVVMRIWGELGFAEIAGVMGVSVSTVHARYVAAIKQLRAKLEKPCPNTTN